MTLLYLALANLGRWLTELAERRLDRLESPRHIIDQIKESWGGFHQ